MASRRTGSSPAGSTSRIVIAAGVALLGAIGSGDGGADWMRGRLASETVRLVFKLGEPGPWKRPAKVVRAGP